MSEIRFPADGVVGILIWRLTEVDGQTRREPCIRIYDPCNPDNGHARKRPDGSSPSFKDYKLRSMIDPSIKIIDEHDAFVFIERENGDRFVDFNVLHEK